MDVIRVSSSGKLEWRGTIYRCALGSGGVVADKHEGDWATPTGSFPLRRVLYRADRMSAPPTALPAQDIKEGDGWCDDPSDAVYNTLVQIPHEGSFEKLWRDDEVYDIIVPLGYNDNPPVAGKGSAIFLHIARPDYSPTAGCVAVSKEDLLAILKTVTPDTQVVIEK